MAKSRFRSRLLFVVPLPLLLTGIGELRAGDSFGMIAEFGALILLLASAWLVTEGLQAEDAYNARNVARPPAIPRKSFAAVIAGCGIALAAYGGMGQDLIPSILTGAIGAAAQFFAFGPDPMRKKGMEGMNEFDTQRVASAVDKAEGLLSETLQAAGRIGDRKLEGRVEQMAATAREMFRAVEDDPRDLTSARKFLGVYLMGARDATVKFADLYAKTRDAAARKDYESLLADLEASFNTQRTAMLADNRSDLDVEIEVLRDRLHQEGLRAERQETL
ncbi:MAG: 5-bromo-4-chloroindolyl phosphate hydrolysis family protein [Pseudomonadota bacterium]